MPVSEFFRWAPVIDALETTFRRLNMTRHAEQLARFKAGYYAQRRKLEATPRPPWTTENIVELASAFHIPPFEKRYAMVPDDKRCPYCRVELAGRNTAPVVSVFVDRTLHECRKCSGRWLLKK